MTASEMLQNLLRKSLSQRKIINSTNSVDRLDERSFDTQYFYTTDLKPHFALNMRCYVTGNGS